MSDSLRDMLEARRARLGGSDQEIFQEMYSRLCVAEDGAAQALGVALALADRVTMLERGCNCAE